MTKLRVLDLFSGIGGFSLGLERTGGFQTVAFCEIEPFCQRVLAKYWPEVPNFGDVEQAEFPDADVITAGFPCQDISDSGTRAGLAGSRSGLFREVVRAVRVVRPLYVLLENVAALLGRGMGEVAGSLAESGYDAEWDCIPAAAVGAPHLRDRIWIVAYPNEGKRRPFAGACHGLERENTVLERPQGSGGLAGGIETPWVQPWTEVADALRRVDDGVRAGLDGYNACGNALCPQIPEAIGHLILAAERRAA